MTRRATSVMSTDKSEASAPIASCSLDGDGLRAQRDRYARLSASVLELRHETAALDVSFAADFDRGTLQEALAVERECCPFFHFELDEARAHLRVTVRKEEQRPALDAIADVLGGREHGARAGGACH